MRILSTRSLPRPPEYWETSYVVTLDHPPTQWPDLYVATDPETSIMASKTVVVMSYSERNDIQSKSVFNMSHTIWPVPYEYYRMTHSVCVILKPLIRTVSNYHFTGIFLGKMCKGWSKLSPEALHWRGPLRSSHRRLLAHIELHSTHSEHMPQIRVKTPFPTNTVS